MSNAGRPRSLDEYKRREIIALLSHGCSLADAASYVGCARSTIHREIRRNSEFRAALHKAQASVQLHPLEQIRNASEKDWRAAAWLLERFNPDRFSRPDKKSLRPDDITQLVDNLLELMATEVEDPTTQQRIYENLQTKATELIQTATNTNRPKRP